MLIPAFTYGHPTVASRESIKHANRAMKPIADAATIVFARQVESSDSPGPIYLDGFPASPKTGFWLGRFMRQATTLEMRRKASLTRLDEVADVLLCTPAGLLMLAGDDSAVWADLVPSAHKKLIRAAMRHWEAIDALGPRFYRVHQLPFWQVRSNVTMALARAGLPDSVFERPLGSGGLRAAVKQHLPRLWEELTDEAS